MPDDQLLTVEQAADHLQVHPETVRRMLRTKRVRGLRIGGTRAGWRIPASELGMFVAAGMVTPRPRRAAPMPSATPGLAHALAEAERYRAEDNLAQAEHWERIAAGIAQSTATA